MSVDSTNEGSNPSSLKPVMERLQRGAEGQLNATRLIDSVLPSGPSALEGLSQRSSVHTPSIQEAVQSALNPSIAPNRETRRHGEKTQDIEDLRKQIAAESILNPNTALSSAEKSLSLEDMSEEQKWAFVAESIMKNPEGLVVREITREDQDILVQMRHPNDGLSDATPVTSPDENVALPAPTPEKPQRTGLLGRFQQWQENRAKAREEKRAAKQNQSKGNLPNKGLAVGGTLTAVGLIAGAVPQSAHASTPPQPSAENTANNGVTTSYTPAEILKMKYGSVQPNNPANLRSQALTTSTLEATNVIGGTVGIDSVSQTPVSQIKDKVLQTPMDVLDENEQKAFNSTGTAADSKVPEKFSETGQSIVGVFKEYFHGHGGLAQQGFPITPVMWEKRKDGKRYQVQYFERAIMEYHPEHAAPNNVLLSLLGSDAYDADPSNLTARAPNSSELVGFNADALSYTFTETGKTVQGRFLKYWNEHGGLAQQGLPRSNMIVKVSDTDGKPYVTQFFERAVFEYHPLETSEEYKVLLSLLGNAKFNEQYVEGPSGGQVTPTPTKINVAPTNTPRPVETAIPVGNLSLDVTYSGGRITEAKGGAVDIVTDTDPDPNVDNSAVNKENLTKLFNRMRETCDVPATNVDIEWLNPGNDLTGSIYRNGADIESVAINVGSEIQLMFQYTKLKDGKIYMQVSPNHLTEFITLLSTNKGRVNANIMREILVAFGSKNGQARINSAELRDKIGADLRYIVGMDETKPQEQKWIFAPIDVQPH